MSRPEFVWKFDINRRKYAEGITGGPIWREHWAKFRIVDENRVSYILEGNNGRVRKTADERTHVFSQEHLDAVVWDHENRYRISRAVAAQSIVSAAQLREIAKIIGWAE
jgi:hypothetical protein